MRPFHHLLVNNLIANITNFTVWFAITFWIFLETRSVFATGMIAGIYLVLTGALGIWFGSLVDHHRKRSMMLVSSVVSLAIYAAALGAYALDPGIRVATTTSVTLWLFVLLTMLGVIVGNIRMIALPILVTLLVPADRRDKANGLVGMVTGIGFLTTSAISGFLVAWGGMSRRWPSLSPSHCSLHSTSFSFLSTSRAKRTRMICPDRSTSPAPSAWCAPFRDCSR